MRTHKHHLLEIILWPNGDGTFKTILNSSKRLKELGIYDDYKLTIPLSIEEHIKLHAKYMSEEHKRKISDALKGKKRQPFTDETRRRMSEAAKGKTMTDESRRKMSEAQKGRKRGPLTAETRRNISEAIKGKHWKLIDGKRVWY